MRSIDLFQQLVQLTPTDPRALTALGSALAASGRTDDAEQRYRAALAVDPTYTDARFDLASLLLKRGGELAEAESTLKMVIAAHRDDAEAHHLLALDYAQQNRLPAALEELHAWQATAPSDPEPHRALAQVLAGMDRMPEALREQEAVVAAVPDSAADWNDLGSLEAQTGDRVAAARDFDRALALDPGLAAAQENLNRLKRK